MLFLFSTFGYIFFVEVKKNYEKSTESLLATAIKDLKYEYIVDINNSYEFEDVKNEFEIKELFAQIVQLKDQKYTIISKSNDLGQFSLPFNQIDIQKLLKNKILYSNQILNQKNIKVATSILYHNNKSTMILQCAIQTEGELALKSFSNYLVFVFILLLALILIAVNIIISRSLNQTKLVANEVKSIKIDGKTHCINKTNIAPQIDEMIEVFNFLINELQTSYKRTKEFGHNASHELKTPLTIVKNELEMGLSKQTSQDEYKEILKKISLEIENLNDVIEKILFLSNAQDTQIAQNFEDVYIDEIIEDALNQKRAYAISKNIKYEIIEFEPVTKQGDYELLKIAFGNIIDNAIKYSNNNSTIEIKLTPKYLNIRDFGIGIDTNQHEKIFEKFYRVKNENFITKGNGLGLALVKNILEIHGFSIGINSQINKGTTFIINF